MRCHKWHRMNEGPIYMFRQHLKLLHLFTYEHLHTRAQLYTLNNRSYTHDVTRRGAHRAVHVGGCGRTSASSSVRQLAPHESSKLMKDSFTMSCSQTEMPFHGKILILERELMSSHETDYHHPASACPRCPSSKPCPCPWSK